MKKIIVYGSLRKDEYNFKSFQRVYGEDNIKYIETTIVDGFKLYSLGSYPGIKQADLSNKLVVDILEVSDEVWKHIEKSAGYYTVYKEIKGDYLPIFIYSDAIYPDALVKSGDWSEYVKQKEVIINEQ